MKKIAQYSTEKILTRLLTNKSTSNQWTYIIELRGRATDDIFRKSVLLTQSSVIKEREIGINILAQFSIPRRHKKKIIQIFFTLLQTETSKTIISAILYGIGHNNEKLTNKQVNILCSFKTHKSVFVRHGLTFALCTIEKKQAVDTLIDLSTDKNSSVRDWATFGLGSQIDWDTEKIRTALWNRVLDEEIAPKLEAISGLAQRKDPRIKAILIEELKEIDEDSLVILRAIDALNDKSFIPLIEKKIEQNKISSTLNEESLTTTLDNLKSIDNRNS